jgi:hypothetical protein
MEAVLVCAVRSSCLSLGRLRTWLRVLAQKFS